MGERVPAFALEGRSARLIDVIGTNVLSRHGERDGPPRSPVNRPANTRAVRPTRGRPSAVPERLPRGTRASRRPFGGAGPSERAGPPSRPRRLPRPGRRHAWPRARPADALTRQDPGENSALPRVFVDASSTQHRGPTALDGHDHVATGRRSGAGPAREQQGSPSGGQRRAVATAEHGRAPGWSSPYSGGSQSTSADSTTIASASMAAAPAGCARRPEARKERWATRGSVRPWQSPAQASTLRLAAASHR